LKKKNLGFETSVGVDELMDKEDISDDEYDDDELETIPQADIANNIAAKAGRNVVQNLAEMRRIILDATAAAVGRIANATAKATTATAMAPSDESTRKAQFRRLKTLLHELNALQPVRPIEETEVVAVNEEETEVEMDTVDLAIDHSTELLCFTTEISSDPGSPKTLWEALTGPDVD